MHAATREGVHVLRRNDDDSEHLVNETALALWQLCDGATTTEEMIEGVCALFDAPREAIADDVASALDQLRQAGLVTWPGGSPADEPGCGGGPFEGIAG